MDSRRWRWQVRSWGLLTIGGGGTSYTIGMWGTSAPLLTAFFGVLAVGSAVRLRGRENAYFAVLTVAGVLALIKAFGYYSSWGMTTLTLAFVLIGAVSLLTGIQGFLDCD